jgi:hypothetical protein
MPRSKRAGGKRNGPSVTKVTTRAAAPANSEAASSVWRQGRSVRPRIRCGVAEPTVSAPTRRPMASPRLSRNHVAAIFIAGGYVPARQTPVRKRRTRAGVRLSTQTASRPFTTAPASAPTIMSVRGDTTSGRLERAAASVPTMKPACTAIVSPARPPSPSAHSRERAGSTAEALNQSDSASSSAVASKPRARHRVTSSLMTCASKHRSRAKRARPAVRWRWRTRRVDCAQVIV